MYWQKRLFPLVCITLLLTSLFNYQSPDYFLAIDIASMKDDKNFMFALISCHKCFTDSNINFVWFRGYLKTEVFPGFLWTLLFCSLCFIWMILYYCSWLVPMYTAVTYTLQWQFWFFSWQHFTKYMEKKISQHSNWPYSLQGSFLIKICSSQLY